MIVGVVMAMVGLSVAMVGVSRQWNGCRRMGKLRRYIGTPCHPDNIYFFVLPLYIRALCMHVEMAAILVHSLFSVYKKGCCCGHCQAVAIYAMTSHANACCGH